MQIEGANDAKHQTSLTLVPSYAVRCSLQVTAGVGNAGGTNAPCAVQQLANRVRLSRQAALALYQVVFGKQVGDPVDKHAHLVAQVAVGWVHDMDGFGL